MHCRLQQRLRSGQEFVMPPQRYTCSEPGNALSLRALPGSEAESVLRAQDAFSKFFVRRGAIFEFMKIWPTTAGTCGEEAGRGRRPQTWRSTCGARAQTPWQCAWLSGSVLAAFCPRACVACLCPGPSRALSALTPTGGRAGEAHLGAGKGGRGTGVCDGHRQHAAEAGQQVLHL